MKNKKFSEEQKKQALNLIKAGKSISEIIKITGLSYPAVYKIRKRYNEGIDPTQPVIDTSTKTVEEPKEINSSDLIQLEDLIQKTPEQKEAEVKITPPVELIKPAVDNSKSISMDQMVGSSGSTIQQSTPDAEKLKAAQQQTSLLATTITQAAFKAFTEKDLPKEQVELIRTSWDTLAPFLITTAQSDKNAAIAGVVIAYGTVAFMNFDELKAGFERIKKKKAQVQQPVQQVQKQEVRVVDPSSVDFVLPK